MFLTLTRPAVESVPLAVRFCQPHFLVHSKMRKAPTTYRRRLLDRAREQYGYVTTIDARNLGIPIVELRKIASRGGLERVAWGVYRFDDVAPSERDQYMEAVLRVGSGAYLAGESVLALHHLALLNPPTIRVATPRRVRTRLPASIETVHANATSRDVTLHEGIPGVVLKKAFLDCESLIMKSRLLEALDDALRRGLLTRVDARTLRNEIGARPRSARRG